MSSQIDTITIIFGSIIVFFFIVELVLISMMKAWVKGIQNFSPKESVNSKVNYDDKMIKSYFSQKSASLSKNNSFTSDSDHSSTP